MTVWFENGASTVHSMILSVVVPPNQLLQQSGAEISKVASFERNPATSRVWQKKKKTRISYIKYTGWWFGGFNPSEKYESPWEGLSHIYYGT